MDNLEHAHALHHIHRSVVRIHKTASCTPAMEAVLTDRLRAVRDIAGLLEQSETRAAYADVLKSAA